MSDKKYVVPEEGMSVALAAVSREDKSIASVAVLAFIRWQAESPKVPTVEQEKSMYDAWRENGRFKPENGAMMFAASEWQRRMYLAPEPEVPEEIKDLMWPNARSAGDHDKSVIEAYRRGKAVR